MIKKMVEIPIYILQLEALLRRLGLGYPNRREIEDELARKLAGHRGEKSLEYNLKYLPEKEYLIFHGLRLPGIGGYFQIDVLIVSLRFIVIVEVKNMVGELEFEQAFTQLIQTKDGVRKVYPDPIPQVERQCDELMRWLKSAKFPAVPIESLVVFTNSQAHIKASPGYTAVYEKVIRSIKLPVKIKEFEKKHKQELLTKREIAKLSNHLLKSDTPYNPDVMEKFSIPRSAIVKGVHCPKCFKLPMTRGRNKWTCQFCNFSSVDAHIASLNDYFLLCGAEITNRELRDFFGLSSKHVTTDILTSLGVPYSGKFRDRVYQLKLLDADEIR